MTQHPMSAPATGMRRTPVMYRVTASTLARALQPHSKAPRTGMAFSTGEARLHSVAGSTAAKAHRDEWHRTGHVILPADVLNALHAAVVDMGRKAVYLVLGAYALQVTTAVGDRELFRCRVARREAIGCQSGFSAHSRRPNECRHCKRDKTEHVPAGLWATLGVVPAGQEPFTQADGVTTWANGFGVWHVRVPDTGDALARASEALREELTAREARVDPNVWINPVPVPEMNTAGTRVWREGHSTEPATPPLSHVEAVRAIRAAAPEESPTEPVDNSREAVDRERVASERALIQESRDGVRVRRASALAPVTPLDVETPPLDYGHAAPVLIIRGSDLPDSDIRTDSIDERHVFHYATHSATYWIQYGAGLDRERAHYFTREGEPLFVWHDFSNTRDGAESHARRNATETAFLSYETRVIVHERTEDRGSSVTLPLRLRLDVDNLMNAGHTVDEARRMIISDVREFVALELGGTAKWSDRLSGVECAGYAWCSEVIDYGTRSASQCDNEALPGTWPPNCGGKH